MTFAELLDYLDAHTPYRLLDGTPEETLAKARSGAHRDPVAGAILTALFDRSGATGASAPVERAQAVAALGPIRLEYMRDDAPVEGFRMVEKIVHAIDGAFNDEALRLKGHS
ncbi:MAG: hypothetical protein ACOZDY_16505 [Pseudomonadota bacterium]